MVEALNHWAFGEICLHGLVSFRLNHISPERSARIVTDRCVGGVGDQKDRNLVPRQLGWLMFELLYIQSEPLTTFSGSPVQARSLESGKWKESRFYLYPQTHDVSSC